MAQPNQQQNQPPNQPRSSPIAKMAGGTVTTDAASAILPSAIPKKWLLGLAILLAVVVGIHWIQAQQLHENGRAKSAESQQSYVSTGNVTGVSAYPIQGGPITIGKGVWGPTVKLKDIFTENMSVGIDEDNVATDWIIDGKQYHQAARNSPEYRPFSKIVAQSAAIKVSDDSAVNTATMRWTITSHN